MQTKRIYLRCTAVVLCALFFINSNLFAQLAAGKDKFLGNTHSKGQTPVNFDMYWNQLTPGNAGKWASCEQKRDDFNYWLWLDRAYSHARQTNMTFKLHTLIWGAQSGEPEWIKSVPENEQKDEVIEWFEAIAERYPDLEMIDVVNEPLHKPPSYKNAIGGDGSTGWDWVVWCFEQARKYFPKSILILNEYNLLNYEWECNNFLKIVKVLQDKKLIDAIGCQSHTLEPIPLAAVKKNMDALAATGLDIYISEYEAQGDDARQLAIFKEQFPLFWEHPSVKGVTLWGYIQGDMWRGQAYLLSSDGKTERPALKWLREEYFKYTTKETKYTFKTSVEGRGKITLDPPGGMYDPFTKVKVTAVPEEGFTFLNWTGDKSGAEATTEMAMTSNRLLTANFSESTPIKTVSTPSEYKPIRVYHTGRQLEVILQQTMNWSADKHGDITIFTIQGKSVWNGSFSTGQLTGHSYTINLSNLGNGSYFTQVKLGDVYFLEKTFTVIE